MLRKSLIILVLVCLSSLAYSRLGTGRDEKYNKFRRNEVSFGYVNFFDAQGGFGLITREGDGRDLFFLLSPTSGAALKEGDRVSFIVVQGASGLEATDVKLIPFVLL